MPTVVFFFGALLCFLQLCSGSPVPAKVRAIPAIETLLAQDFEVSVVTQSFGVFNASLRISSSLNFPERLHGELIPHGQATLKLPHQVALPHFGRERELLDDRLSSLHAAGNPSTDAASATQVMTHPTFLSFDLTMRHLNATGGLLQVYLLPADLPTLQQVSEAIQEGSQDPWVTVDISFRAEHPAMAVSPISDVAPLSRVASAPLKASAEGSTEGEFTWRLLSEHEFSVAAQIPLANGVLERVWMHAYVPPSKAVFTRGEFVRPWWHLPMMVGVGLLTFVVQVLSGLHDGKRRAKEASEEREKPVAIASAKKKH